MIAVKVRVERQPMSQQPYDYSTRRGVRPISWNDFHGICRELAVGASKFQPQIVVPVGRGGFYPGTLLGHMLRTEIYPVRVSRRVNDVVRHDDPQWLVEPPELVAGHRVLIVDETCSHGRNLAMFKNRVDTLGASKSVTAVMYAHTWGAGTPDLIGLITDELLLNPWDREVLQDGRFEFHPEYVAALGMQGVEPSGSLRIQATEFDLAKG